MPTLSDFTAQTLGGHEQDLGEYAGKVVLVVNTASQCGFTPQFGGLERLWDEYGDDGLVVLGFPCDQFGNQEPGDEAAIAEFCSLTYDVTFPMHAKIDVNGPATHPLYPWLKAERPGLLGSEGIKWNFTKFLIDRDGRIACRYAPTTKPEAIRSDVEELLEGN